MNLQSKIMYGAIGGTLLFAFDATGPAPAQAQTSIGVEEITVTSRKREENLQEVPLSITAFTGDQLRSSGVENLRDLSYLTPGLSMLDFGAETFTTPNIRGLTQSNTAGGINNVSIFIDGVYIFNFNAVNLSLIDVERIEVVKGPVSALYGRNSFAGAINYVTKKPGDEFSGRATATVGTDNKYMGNVSLSGPIIEGKLSAGVSAVYDSFNGTWQDEVNGRDLGGYEKKGGQFNFVATPTEDFEITGAIYYGNDFFDPPARSVLTNNCAELFGRNREYCGRIPDGEDIPPEAPSEIAALNESGNDRELFHAALSASYDFGPAALDVLFGYTDIDFRRFSSFDNLRDGLTYPLIPGPGTINLNSYFGNVQQDEDWSIEARITSAQDQDFRWTFGGFVYDLDRFARTNIIVVNDTLPAGQTIPGLGGQSLRPSTGPFRDADVTSAIRQQSLFVGGEYDVTDALTIGAEVRYSHEEQDSDTISNLFGPIGLDPDGDGETASWDFIDTRVTADYQLTDDALIYASAAKGSKSGGFNAGSADPDEREYDPEKNWTYEAGAKTTWMDGSLLLNASVFYIDWSDLQIRTLPNDPSNPGTVLRNVGKAASKGFELEMSAVLAEGVVWGVGVGYSDPEFGSGSFDATNAGNCALIPSCASKVEQIGGRSVINLDGTSLHRQSDWQFNTNIALDGDLFGNWDWFARGDYAYQSKQNENIDANSFWGSRNIVNMRLGAQTDTLRVEAWVDNLLDDTTPTINGTAIRLADFVTANQPLLPTRRVWGLTVTANF